MTKNYFRDPDGEQEAQFNSYGTLSPYVMTYLLIRRVEDERTWMWRDAQNRMNEGEAGKESAAYSYIRWLELDICSELLHKVFAKLSAFRSPNDLDAQVMARATMDDVGVDWDKLHRVRKAG